MQTDVKQVFYFHADANSLGGFLEEPFRYIPTPCSVALSSTGGSVTQDKGAFDFEGRIHAKASYTHVSGSPSRKNGPWVQRVVSMVEGFSVLGRVSAERLVAQVFIQHPRAGGGERKISFAGSHISNLRVDGKLITPRMNSILLPENQRFAETYNRDASVNPELEWPRLWQTAYRQGIDRHEDKAIPRWVRDRYGWIGARGNSGEGNLEGYTLCSLVDKIDGLAPDQSFGHFIELPDLGRIFLGEVTVFPQAVTLTMVRTELGCAITGQASAACVVSNGTTMPPGLFSGL